MYLKQLYGFKYFKHLYKVKYSIYDNCKWLQF